MAIIEVKETFSGTHSCMKRKKLEVYDFLSEILIIRFSVQKISLTFEIGNVPKNGNFKNQSVLPMQVNNTMKECFCCSFLFFREGCQ